MTNLEQLDVILHRIMEYVRRYNDEVAYQLADGYVVNNGYYCIYPNIGGTFNSAKDVRDPKVNLISFRFGIRSRLRNLIKNIAVDIDGAAQKQGAGA